MGEISEMMLEGILCQECGGYIDDGQADNYPRSCKDCIHDAKEAKP